MRHRHPAGGDPLAGAVSAYARNEWSMAEVGARSILKKKPSDPDALRLLARAAARQGRDELAEAIYRRLGTGPMRGEDLFLFGRGLLGRGQVRPALAFLGAAREIEPDHAETLDALSRYWAETRSLCDAADAALRLMKQPGWEVVGGVRLGRLRAELFDPAGAAVMLEQVLRRDPGLTRADLDPRAARRLIARSWLAARRPVEARAQLQGSSPQDLDQEGWWLLSRAYLQEGKIAEAFSALGAARGFGASNPLFREPAPFLGSAACASCHRALFQSQQSSRHSRTLKRTAELTDLAWPKGNLADAHNPRVQHRFARLGDRIEVRTHVDDQAFGALVEYALGSNHQGQSFLAREADGQIRELRVSHYPSAPEWSRTMEHPAQPPDAPGYMGRPITPDAFRRCLNCHSTNFRAVLEPAGRPEARDHGIGCERCHGPAGNHPAAIAASFPELAIARPRLASAAQTVALCGECHTAPSKITPDDPGFVRYQASSLVKSRCYTESDQSFSCVTCHDPHRDAAGAAASSRAECLACHPSSRPTAPDPSAKASQRWPSCPVKPRGDCLACHMPRVKDAVPRTQFTDHWIRATRDAAARTSGESAIPAG